MDGEQKLCKSQSCKTDPKDQVFGIRVQSKDGLSSVCKVCKNRSDTRSRRSAKRVKRDYILNYLKDHPCSDCGETDPVVLEFDHQHSKKYDVSSLINSSHSLKTLKKEIEKCQVLCANCHRRKTSVDQNWYSVAK